MSLNNEIPSTLCASPLPYTLPKPGMAYYPLPAQIVNLEEYPKPQLELFLGPR
jgi:hypothetical protein